MTISYDDLCLLRDRLAAETEDAVRSFFANFDEADFNRGDIIILHPSLLRGEPLPEILSERVQVSKLLPEDAVVILRGSATATLPDRLHLEYAQHLGITVSDFHKVIKITPTT